MNTLNTSPSQATPVDEDLAAQANPGHGIPSQDPAAAAQTVLEPHEAEREGKSVLVGGGMVAGPVGILAGGALGAVAGALGGAAAGAAANTETTDSLNPPSVESQRLHAEGRGSP